METRRGHVVLTVVVVVVLVEMEDASAQKNK